MESMISMFQETSMYMTESDDVSDEDIEELDKEVHEEILGKKPESKNLATKVQHNAMDKEAKWYQKQAKRQQKKAETGNAIRAVAAVPNNIVNSIKDQVHQIDKLDDERRKRHMTEPGFRKKAFRNLKLAILYGSAATVKLSLIPIVAVCRHFSKEKDERIRNELVRNIQTEIRVCEEKISDANSKGDEKEKYRLMRIKDKLDAEMIRVKTNSKYV